MSSRAGSALLPSSRTVAPFTCTRPSSISCSLARRDATPACDRIFWIRSTETVYHAAPKLGIWNLEFGMWNASSAALTVVTTTINAEPRRARRTICTESAVSAGSALYVVRSAREQIAPESCELDDVLGVRGAIGFGVRDQAAQHQPHRRVAAEIFREVLRLDGRHDVVLEAVEQEDRRRRLRRLR